MPLTRPYAGFRGAQYHSIDTMNSGPVVNSTNLASTAYPTANLAIYVPVRVRFAAVVKQLWVANQLTATGNIDLGLYNAGGTKLVSSGSTAKTAGTGEQVIDVTDTTITPGLYYLALNCSNNTDTFSADTDAAPGHAACGLLTEALGAVTLQATASWAVNQTLAFWPFVGMFLDTTVT